MTYTKTLATVGTILAIGATMFLGCKDESENKEKYLTYSEYAGTTAGYIVNASAVFIGPEVKAAITNVLAEIKTNLPKEVTAETIDNDMRTIATNAVAHLNVNEKYKELVDKSVDTLLTVLKVGMVAIKDKHPIEFGNAELFYTIAYTFFDSVNSVIDPSVPRGNVEETELKIADVDFATIKAKAKEDGRKIDKRAFNGIIKGLKK